MPIYEYICNSCHTEFEEIVFDDQNPKCTSCDSVNTQKLMSRTCNYSSGNSSDGANYTPSGSKGGCGGCSGGNCSTCK